MARIVQQELIQRLKAQVEPKSGRRQRIMNTHPDKLVCATPAVCSEMAARLDNVAVLAGRHGVSQATAS